jgi:hypothetical protein
VQLYTLSKTSLAKAPSSVTELYIPLWVADGTTANVGGASAGAQFIGDGNSGYVTSSSSNAKLHTLSSGWSPTTQFAFEITFYVGNSAATAYAELWDLTAGAAVSASQVSTTSTTPTVVRSGKFTLTPGHQYGVTCWVSNTSYSTYPSDAHLIVFP